MADAYTTEEMARVLGIAVSTLVNRISAGKGHPPFYGKGKERRFPKAEFEKWARTRLVYEVRKAS